MNKSAVSEKQLSSVSALPAQANTLAIEEERQKQDHTMRIDNSNDTLYMINEDNSIKIFNKKNILCTIFIKRLGNKPIILNLMIYKEFLLLDLLKFLVNISDMTNNLSKGEFDNSSFYIPHLKKKINLSNIDEKLIDNLHDNDVIGNKSIELIEKGMLMPKNDFEKTINILGLYHYNLQSTINIDKGDNDGYDICNINYNKIGSWNGFGQGNTKIDYKIDNHIKNLIFIKYKNHFPVAYNIHCLKKLIKGNKQSILIPHLNKNFNTNRFKEIYMSNDKFKILHLNDSDEIN